MWTHARAFVAALALVLALAAVAAAQDPIRNLRVSTTPDGSKAGTMFPAGTEALYAVFTYSDLADDRVTVTIEGRGVAGLASNSTRLTGSGVASLELAGEMVYKSVATRVVQEAENARDTVNRASGASVGLQEYLQQILAASYAMDALTDYLADVPISEPLIQQTATARDGVAELQMLAEEALRLRESDVAGRQAKATAMKRPVGTIVTSARQIEQGAASVTDAPIAASPEGTDYTIQVSINDLPSSSVDIVVSARTRAFLPSIVKHHTLPSP